MQIEQRYTDGTYYAANPDWDRGDAPWKAGQVARMLADHGIQPASMCDVGCGAGDVLRELARSFPDARLTGYDVAPDAERFWRADDPIRFVQGEFHALNTERHDVLLLLDVFEHVRDPFTFLEESRAHARHVVCHIPLDLSAASVARATPLMTVRRRVGHLHFYTKDLALETLTDSGYRILDWRYTGAALTGSNRTWKTRLAQWPRRLAYAVNKDAGVRLLGGETLLVLAEPAERC